MGEPAGRRVRPAPASSSVMAGGGPRRKASSSRQRSEPVPHNGIEMGKVAHRVIGRLLAAGVREPSPEEMLSFAAHEPLLHERHVYRLAARQRLIAATAIYWRHFLPASPPWRFVDYAVPLDASDLDLVFEHADGGVRSDELQTGGAPALAEREELDQQLQRQLAGGRQKYGERYRGVRVLFLGAPRRSFVVSVDGSRAPLFEGGCDDKPNA